MLFYEFAESTSCRRTGRRAQVRFLPPYSPDVKPIELAFAQLKAFLRAMRPRTFEQVCDLICDRTRSLRSDECANYARPCGYRVTAP